MLRAALFERRTSLLSVLLLLLALSCGCGEDEANDEGATVEEASAESEERVKEPAETIDFSAFLATKLYGFQPMPASTEVVKDMGVATFISTRPHQKGTFLRAEVSLVRCVQCVPMGEKKEWKRRARLLERGKRARDPDAVLMFKKVQVGDDVLYGFYAQTLSMEGEEADSRVHSEHSYALRINNGQNELSIRVAVCDKAGHPFAATRQALAAAATPRELERHATMIWKRFRETWQ